MLCDQSLEQDISIVDYLFRKTKLCGTCYQSLIFKPQKIQVEEFKVQSYYLYNEGFKRLLLQYKEAYDEALAPLFLERLHTTLLRYRHYTIVFVPSSQENIARRGFHHLQTIFQNYKTLDLFYKSKNHNQNHLNAVQRQEIKQYIHIKPIPLPKKILLVDDVLTSGSSVLSCARLLKNKAVKLKIFVLSYNHLWKIK